MTRRYFVESPIDADRALLSGSEAHHLLHVMRAGPGDEVTLFDGRGGEFTASVAACRRAEVELTLGPRQPVEREAAIPITLGVALPKGDRQKWLVEKATELGVARLVPLVTERSVARPKPAVVERCRRAVIEASKQCGRNRLMEIAEPVSLAEFTASAPDSSARWLAHPGGESISAEFVHAGTVFAAVGPEGGFADQEVAAAREQGWRTIGLGPRILRVETAAILMASVAALASTDSR
jgi:16S rRNA (uracil1498-N3)-methyltransferase